jgi:hypothetical protein
LPLVIALVLCGATPQVAHAERGAEQAPLRLTDVHSPDQVETLVAHFGDRATPLSPQLVAEAIESRSWPILLQVVRVA